MTISSLKFLDEIHTAILEYDESEERSRTLESLRWFESELTRSGLDPQQSDGSVDARLVNLVRELNQSGRDDLARLCYHVRRHIGGRLE